MKTLSQIMFSVAALLAISPAAAQTAAKPATPEVQPAKHFTTTDTAIGDLLADPTAKAVVDKHIPGLSDSPSIGLASGMTMRAIQPMAGDTITVAMLDAIDADLAKLPAK